MPVSKYKPEYGPQLLEFMAQGKSVLQFAASIGVHKDSIYEWKNRHPEFTPYFELAIEAYEAWWTELGRLGTSGALAGKFNPVSYIYSMKARFGGKWLEDGRHDKLEISAVNRYSDKELKEKIQNKLEQMGHIVNIPKGQVAVLKDSTEADGQ